MLGILLTALSYFQYYFQMQHERRFERDEMRGTYLIRAGNVKNGHVFLPNVAFIFSGINFTSFLLSSHQSGNR